MGKQDPEKGKKAKNVPSPPQSAAGSALPARGTKAGAKAIGGKSMSRLGGLAVRLGPDGDATIKKGHAVTEDGHWVVSSVLAYTRYRHQTFFGVLIIPITAAASVAIYHEWPESGCLLPFLLTAAGIVAAGVIRFFDVDKACEVMEASSYFSTAKEMSD